MTRQQEANALLDIWQRNRDIPPTVRVPPQNDNRSLEEFEQDLAIIRACMERRS